MCTQPFMLSGTNMCTPWTPIYRVKSKCALHVTLYIEHAFLVRNSDENGTMVEKCDPVQSNQLYWIVKKACTVRFKVYYSLCTPVYRVEPICVLHVPLYIVWSGIYMCTPYSPVYRVEWNLYVYSMYPCI